MTSANYCSQKIVGAKRINTNSLTAFGIYGLLFGGTLPHYFYQFLENFLPEHKAKKFMQFFAERLFFMPAFTLFSLYVLSRLEVSFMMPRTFQFN
jgi:peroxisomal membrane protein 2